MKLINKFLGLGLLILFASACAKDNFQEPNRPITVKIVSKTDGVVLPTRNSKTSNINFNVVQTDEKWTLTGTDYAFTNNDGEVNMNWFDGNYLFFAPAGRGSWKKPWPNGGNDTISFTINGKKTYVFDYPVDPYYLFQNVTYTLSGNTLSVSGTIKEYNSVVIENIYLVIKNSPLICNVNYSNRQAIAIPAAGSFPATFNASMTVSAADMEKASLYARVVMKFAGSQDWQMGPIQKMK